MKHLLLVSLLLLSACGGGGVEQTIVTKPDPQPTQPTTPPATNVDVPADFDFSNFQTVEVVYSVPGDLLGQIDLKITGEWDNQVQDLYIGRGIPGQSRSIPINIPTTVTTLAVEYFAFDVASGHYEIRIEEIQL